MKSIIKNNIKWFVLTLFFGLTAAIGSSYGQSTPSTTGAGKSDQYTEIQKKYNTGELSSTVVKIVVDEVSNVVKELESNKILESSGDNILYMLFALIIAWGLLKAMMGNGFSQFIEEMIVVFLYWGIVYAFLHAGGIQAIKQFVDSVASTFVGKDMSTLGGALKSTVETGFDAITSIVSMPDLQTRITSTMTEDEADAYNDKMGDVPLMILSLVNIVSKIAAGFIVSIALVTYCANILISFASIAIAVALAPIMVPFYILPSTRFLFDGWLRFFLGAAFIKVVGAFFLHFTDQLLRTMLKVADNLKLPKDADFMTLLNGNFMLGICCIILAMLSAHLMAMAPGIAAGLLSGSSVNGGFAGMGKAIGGMAIQSFNPVVHSPKLKKESKTDGSEAGKKLDQKIKVKTKIKTDAANVSKEEPAKQATYIPMYRVAPEESKTAPHDSTNPDKPSFYRARTETPNEQSLHPPADYFKNKSKEESDKPSIEEVLKNRHNSDIGNDSVTDVVPKHTK